MSQSYDDAGEDAVFVGFWVDHGRGSKFLGATLTLPARHAVVLLAFLAVLVTFAATRSWLFWRFLLHNLISGEAEAASAPARLRQKVIIRNVVTPSAALWSLLSTDSLKPNTRKDSQRGFFLGLFAAGHVLIFAAASILTSQVITGQTVVSRVTETCGQWRIAYEGGVMNDDVYLLGRELDRNATVDADNYVRNCHSNRGTSRQIMSCNKLLTRELSFHTETGAGCPFRDDVCLTGNLNLPFVMDTGNITLADLGINSKFARDLTVRRRTTCVPLDAERFRVPNSPELAKNALVAFSSYAFLTINGTATAVQLLQHPNVSLDYDLNAYSIVAPAGVELAAPLQKDQDDHTVSLILLSGTGIAFASPNDDPLFSANTKKTPTSTLYRTDRIVNMIGCDERAQFCSSLTGRCTSWGDLLSTYPDAISVLGGEVAADDAVDILYSTTLIHLSLQTTSLPESVSERAASAALQAGRYLYHGKQGRIEPGQWKRELEYWFAVGLARLQLEIFGTVEKPPGVNSNSVVNRWDTDKFKALKVLCGRVKFRSPGHTSLSTLGLGLILGVSGVLVLLSFADVVVPWLLRSSGYEFREWEQTDMLKLLKRTLEAESCLDTVADPFLTTRPEKGVIQASVPA